MAATQQQVIDQITEQAMAALAGQESQDVQAMADAFTAARDAIIARVQQLFPGQNWDLVTMQSHRFQQLLSNINAEIAKLNGQLYAGTMDAATQQFQDSQTWSAYTLDQATPANININFTQPPVGQINALLNTPFQGAMFKTRYGAMSDAMASDIRDELTQSMINGESMDDAADRISDVMGDGTTAYSDQALTIARTEIMRASNLGAWDVFQNQNPDIMAGEPDWFATADDRLCPWCLGRDGKTTAEIKQLHLTARGKSDPFRGSATMPLHPRCRCRWLPRLKTWKELGVDIPDEAADDARSMRNDAGKWVTAPVQSFDEWQAGRAQTFQMTGHT